MPQIADLVHLMIASSGDVICGNGTSLQTMLRGPINTAAFIVSGKLPALEAMPRLLPRRLEVVLLLLLMLVVWLAVAAETEATPRDRLGCASLRHCLGSVLLSILCSYADKIPMWEKSVSMSKHDW